MRWRPNSFIIVKFLVISIYSITKFKTTRVVVVIFFSEEINWSTRYWPGRFHVYLLEITEVNANYLRGHLVDGAYVKPMLEFLRQLGFDMVGNNLDEKEEARGVQGRRLRERKLI